MADLHSYVIEQEHAGYSEAQIRQALQQNGYTQVQIDTAFKELKPEHDDHAKGYAQEYARQGYTPQQTFSQLTSQGYPAGTARKAVNDVYGKGSVATESRIGTVAFVLVALLIGAGGTYLMLGGTDTSPTPVTPLATQQTLSQSEIIADILEVTRQEGKDTGVADCHARLVGQHREQCLAVVAAATEDRSVCSQIVSAEIHDSCQMNFLNENFDAVCSSVRLTDSRQTCDSLSALRTAA